MLVGSPESSYYGRLILSKLDTTSCKTLYKYVVKFVFFKIPKRSARVQFISNHFKGFGVRGGELSKLMACIFVLTIMINTKVKVN